MRTSLELECFDGTYSFRLTMAGIIAIETKCDAGIGEIFARTGAGRYNYGDQGIGAPLEGKYRYGELVEIIRQALIGGGSGYSDGQPVKVDAVKANHLINIYINADKDNPVSKAWDMAFAILVACVEGYEPAVTKAPEDTKKKTKSVKRDNLTAEKSSPTA